MDRWSTISAIDIADIDIADIDIADIFDKGEWSGGDRKQDSCLLAQHWHQSTFDSFIF